MKDFYKHILISIITYILFSSFLSCTENVISYNEITENNQEKLINKDTLDKTGLNRIDFWAGINNNYFRSYGSEPIQTDINVSIYAFYYGGDSVTSAQYVSKTAGALTPVDNPMELLGLYKYSIYAAAVNNKNVV